MIPMYWWLLGDLDPNGVPNSASLYRFQHHNNINFWIILSFMKGERKCIYTMYVKLQNFDKCDSILCHLRLESTELHMTIFPGQEVEV